MTDNEKSAGPYRVEWNDGVYVIMRANQKCGLASSYHFDDDTLSRLLNAAFAAGLEQGRKERMDVAVLSGFEAGQKDYERYKKAWEEMSALIRLNFGMTPIEVDHIARKYGLEEK